MDEKKQKGAKNTVQKWVLFLLSFAIIGVLLAGGFFYKDNLDTQKKLEEFYLIEKTIQEEEPNIPRITDFVVEYEGTLQASLLSYYTAVYYFSEKNFVEAEKWLLTVDIEKENLIGNMSKFLLANIYQEQKKYEDSISILGSIDVPSLTDYLVMEIIQNQLLAGETIKAKEQLQNFLKQFKRSPLKASAEEILKLIG